jgi:hypothetical protein
MCKKRKKTAAPATPRSPVRWKIETVMHSPMRARMVPEKPKTGREIR